MNKQYRHKTTKHIAEQDNLKPERYNISGLNTQTILPKEWIENSSDWEEIISKDYEILSFKSTIQPTEIKKVINNTVSYGNLSSTKSVEDVVRDWVIDHKTWEIHSVKRLSDGVIFSIGDTIKHENVEYKIESFKTHGGTIMIANWQNNNSPLTGSNIKLIQKVEVKPVLFTTHDGVDITDISTIIWYCFKTGYDRSEKDTPTGRNGIRSLGSSFCYFSTKQLCQDYLDNIHNTKVVKPQPKEELITVQLTKEKYDLLMQLLEE